jgi:hypothetical protein
MSSGTRLLVIERAMKETDPLEAAVRDLTMLVLFGSRDRTTGEYHELVERARFRVTRATTGPSGICVLGVPVAQKKFPTDIPLTWDNEGLADRSLIFAASLSSERETLLGYRRPAVMRVRRMAETRLPGFQLVVCPHIINKMRFTE